MSDYECAKTNLLISFRKNSKKKMIKAILIFNNQGKPRMTKFYQRYSEPEQQAMIEVLKKTEMSFL